MVDDEVDPIDEAAVVVRLHVDHGDPIELFHRVGGQDFDVDVEQVDHPEVLGTGDALQRAQNRRGLGAAQQVTQREARRQRVRIGIVVEQDQHAIGVVEETLILLDAGAGQGPADLGDERPADELGHREERQFGKRRAQLVLPPLVGAALFRARLAQDIHQRGSGVPDGIELVAQPLTPAVFDDDAGGGADVGLDVGLGLLDVAGDHRHAGIVQAPGQRTAFHQEVDVEAGGQDLLQEPDNQLSVTDGQASHV